MQPVRELPERLMSTRFERFSSALGIWPVSSLLLRSRIARLERLPSSLRYGAAQVVASEHEPLEAGSGGRALLGMLPGQPVGADVQHRQSGQVAEFGGYLTGQMVDVEVE